MSEAPPLARIEYISATTVPPLTIAVPEPGRFVIRRSQARPGEPLPILPDVAVCDDCLRELFDPDDRRYRYPFINCANCGPRLTIIRDIPYNRSKTTMAPFRMCLDCQAEYDAPANRRFHAQPNACHVCGPRVWLKSSLQVKSASLQVCKSAGLQVQNAGTAAASRGRSN